MKGTDTTAALLWRGLRAFESGPSFIGADACRVLAGRMEEKVQIGEAITSASASPQYPSTYRTSGVSWVNELSRGAIHGANIRGCPQLRQLGGTPSSSVRTLDLGDIGDDVLFGDARV